jgi:RimJ/RimL family protein N-acetyltransferase
MSDQSTPGLQERPIVILTTPRLTLRSATEQDIPLMHERVLGDSDVMRYVFQGVPMTEERAEQVMRKFFTFGDRLTGIAVLTDRSTGDIIGFAGLFPCEALGAEDLEIGFVLSRNVWAGGSPPRSARRNLHSVSNSSTASDCWDWSIPETGHRCMRSKSSDCDMSRT